MVTTGGAGTVRICAHGGADPCWRVGCVPVPAGVEAGLPRQLLHVWPVCSHLEDTIIAEYRRGGGGLDLPILNSASSVVPPMLVADTTLLLSTSAAGLHAQLDLLALMTPGRKSLPLVVLCGDLMSSPITTIMMDAMMA